MRACVFCGTRYLKGSGVTFHKFPVDIYIRELWVKNMKKKNYTPKATDYLCSKHFTEGCLIQHEKRTTLEYGSIPTLFYDTGTSESQNMSKTSSEGHENVEQDHPKEKLELEHENVEGDDSHYDNIMRGHHCVNIARDSENVKLNFVNNKHDSVNIKREHHVEETHHHSENVRRDHYYEIKQPRSIFEASENIKHDHNYISTPMSTEKVLLQLRKALKQSQTRAKVLSQKVKRLKITVSSLESI